MELFLILAAALAGFIDSIAGGGGLIQLPSLLISMPDKPIVEVLGTNKFAAIFGTGNAALRYRRQVSINPKFLAAISIPAFIGSMFGALMAAKMPTDLLRYFVFFALIAIAIYTYSKPELGEIENIRHSHNHQLLIGSTAGLLIGFYDGIFGPGTGTFLMAVLIALLGFTFLTASAIAKFTNVATNLAALIIFAIHGAIIWQTGLLMAAAGIIGSIFGTKMALRGGSPLVRKVFLLVTIALIAKVGIDLLN